MVVYRETRVLLDPLERLDLSALRDSQENQEQKVSEDSRDQWSVSVLNLLTGQNGAVSHVLRLHCVSG